MICSPRKYFSKFFSVNIFELGIEYEFTSDADMEHTCDEGFWSADSLGKYKPRDLVSHSCL